MSEYDFYQIDATGVDEPDRVAARTDVNVPIRRALDSKINNFGALNVGAKMAGDYTRTDLNFKSKDNLLDHNVLVEDTGIGQNVGARAVTVNHNPYVLGGTIKLVRDDQFFRMSMTNDRGTSIDAPGFDVMDTNVVHSGMTAGKNWPMEGWRSLGGKYDFTPYVGGGSVH